MIKKDENEEVLTEENAVENTEELSYEDFTEAGEYSEKTAKDKIKALREKLKESEAKAKEYLDGWQRAQADMVNANKKQAEDRMNVIKMAGERVFESIIPTFDSFEMAKANKEAWEKVDANWRVGIEYIFSNLQNVLADDGLKKWAPSAGDTFDVNTMQAVEEIETDDEAKDHTVESLVQSGYKLYEKLLREAKVKVYLKK